MRLIHKRDCPSPWMCLCTPDVVEDDPPKRVRCSRCRGKGEIKLCPNCNAEGGACISEGCRVVTKFYGWCYESCPTCGGTGEVEER